MPNGHGNSAKLINVTHTGIHEETPSPPAPSQKLGHEITAWLNGMQEEQKEITASNGKVVIYVIESAKDKEAFVLSPLTVSILKKGGLSLSRNPCGLRNADPYKRGKYVQDSDVTILRLISGIIPYYEQHYDKFKIPAGEDGLVLLKLLIATGRCYLPNETLPQNHLVKGEARKAKISWRVRKDGAQSINIKVEGVDEPIILALQEPHYICPLTRTVGLLDTGLPNRQTLALLQAPSIKPEQAAAVSEKLVLSLGSNFPDLLPATFPMRKITVQPVPCLRLGDTLIQPLTRTAWNTYASGAPLSVATMTLSFDYNGALVVHNSSKNELQRFSKGEVVVIPRDKVTEQNALNFLRNYSYIVKLQDMANDYRIKHSDLNCFTIANHKLHFHNDDNIPKRWEKFVQESLPSLKEQGWKISMEQNFPYNIIKADDEWYAEVEEGSGIDWFGIELGVTVNGERLNLVPILLELLRKNENIFEVIESLPVQEQFLVPTGDGRRIALPSERIKILIGTLKHLFLSQGNIDQDRLLKMQKLDAALIAEIEAAGKALNMRWFGGDTVRSLGKQMKEFTSIKKVALPRTFHGELRQYQQEGLNWLQFLREYYLSGILADDMGLGKTVQMLAHISVEKAAKRLNNPALVIAPTSLMLNWKMEAERFTPDLKVLTLHGSERKTYFGDIKKYDLILTTYPLLLRDKEKLLSHEYYFVILDEAQTIKNARAKITQIVNQLKAKHRLCMTGTPLENHLGELWSLFNFLLPGYLGTYKQFGSVFRIAIEKNKNRDCSGVLSRRIKPFVLRRTKQEVVAELPLKTEICRMVELDSTQRDLYETIRASMHEKILSVIAEHGMDRSHIIVLDALLKLRQVCCDPALLKLDIAKDIVNSAKREELMTMLTSMVGEGRKVLLFSQFASMLALIAKQLEKLGIAYVILTGKTLDRETPIRQFQEGKVPLFLISLKAGGTGLNLTAADTVIHYDPWWNPATENQATDRAYRIGQDKPVFVYKLITKGTVEEKIVEMQNKKRQLMDSLFDPEAKSFGKLTARDIQSLFEPLEVVSSGCGA